MRSQGEAVAHGRRHAQWSFGWRPFSEPALWICGLTLLLAGLIGALLVFHAMPMIIALGTPATVPDLPSPTAEHHWDLDEKIAAWRQPDAGAATKPSKPLHLTPAEANAWLARQTPIPAAGFAWNRARLTSGPTQVDLVVHGSGWWQRALTLVVRAIPTSDDLSRKSLVIESIRLNSLDLWSGWRRQLGISFLRAFLARNWPLLIDAQGTVAETITVEPDGGFVISLD